MAESALQINDLSKDFTFGMFRRTRRPALKKVTFGVERGEVFGYLGPNGSGKTTTLKLVIGLLFPDAGSITVLGHAHADSAWRYKIGYLPEHPYFYDYLTPAEYLTYAGRLMGMEHGRIRERSRELLDRVKLARSADVPLRRFSKGMLQRLGIAQALIHDPELLFLDEPMSGLDPLGRRLVRDLILELKSKGKTIFFSTHILSDAETLCDRVAMLRGGALVSVGALADILKVDVSHMEVFVSGLRGDAPALPPGARVTQVFGERSRLEAPEGVLAETLSAVQRAGGRVLAVQAVRESLEDYFVREVGGAAEDTVRRDAWIMED
jgi:ABC-2 type transport system ATP-binding protein